jgi:hypothetical protein
LRLGGDDRNDRDLRLIQGSALDRLLSDKTLRARLGQQLAKADIQDQLKPEAKTRLDDLDKAFDERALPHGLNLGVTGGPGVSKCAHWPDSSDARLRKTAAPFRGSMRFVRSLLIERKGSPRYNVKAVEEHFGSTKALPDDRVLVTLADGRSFVIDGERLTPQSDGTYVIALNDADRFQLSRSQARDPDDASSGKRYV